MILLKKIISINHHFFRFKKIFFKLVPISVLSVVICLNIGYFTPKNFGNNSCDLNLLNKGIPIYIYNTGIHTDILVTVNTKIWDWQQHLNIKLIANPSASINYLAFGFGDRAYFLETYTETLLPIATTFKALFLPTPSAMRVLAYQNIPQQYEIKCVIITEFNYLMLMEFINNSFQFDAQGNRKSLIIDPNYRVGFYGAKDTYSILRTCNDWTAEALRLAGVKTPLWPGLSSSIMYHLKSGCAKCSYVHQNLGGSKHFKCPHWGHSMPKNWNGALGIFLKALLDNANVDGSAVTLL